MELTFPSAEKQPERRSPRVQPGETVRVTFTWKTANYEAGAHTLIATLRSENNATTEHTSAQLQFILTPPAITATIVDISADPEAPTVGQPVAITVTVRNDGPIAANIPVTLRFPSADKQPETRRPRVGPGETAAVTFTWRTGNYLPGAHDFRVEVPSTSSPSDQRLTVELLPAPVNVSIVGIGADPEESAIQGQQVEIWVDIRNDGAAATNVPVELTFPSAEKQPERKSPRVQPGQTMRVTFTWKTANYEAGAHTLVATLRSENNATTEHTSAQLQFILTPPTITATIVDISADPEAPTVGQPVTITVTVRNDGPIAANIPVTLHFPFADKQPEIRSPRVEPGATTNVAFTWRTGNYQPGVHDFRVEVPSTSSPSDQRLTVELLSAPVNVSIVGIGADPEGSAMLGEPVEISVTVRNDGPTATHAPIRLTFPSENKAPEQKSSRILPGQTAAVSFTWKTRNYEPGVYVLRAELLLEDNATLGNTSAELQFLLDPPVTTATIMDISTAPEAPVVGQPVSITVSVRNDGPIAANIPVTLHFPSSADKQPETRRPRVEPGASATVTFTWRTGNYQTGAYNFRVEVPSTSTSSDQRFTVALLPATVKVSIVGIGADPAGSATQGEWVEIWVEVRNDGAVATRVPVRLIFPSDDKMPEHRSPHIPPAETVRVTFTWKTANYDVGHHTLVAALLSEDNVSTGDTSAQLQFRITAPAIASRAGAGAVGGGAGAGAVSGAAPAQQLPVPPQAIVSRVVAIETHPQSPVVGEPVTITIAVSNDGPTAASVPVTLHFPSADKQPETRRPRVAPGSTGAATFTWRTSRYAPGAHHFRVEVGVGASTVRRFTIELHPPTVDFAVAEIYPPSVAHPVVKGDWVEVAAFVRNLGSHGGRATIHLYNDTEHKAMYSKNLSLAPGESKVVEFTWKTLRYTEGENEIFVLSNAAYDENRDNDRSPTAIVNILTNRDITVGFGIGDLPDTTADATSVPSIRTTAAYLDEILVLGAGSPPAGRVTLAPPTAQIGAQPQRHDDADHPAAIHRLWQSAQTSATDCVRLQSLLGQNQPRAVLCPDAPALIR